MTRGWRATAAADLGDLLAVVEDEMRAETCMMTAMMCSITSSVRPRRGGGPGTRPCLDLGGIEAGEHLVEQEGRGEVASARANLEPFAQLDGSVGRHVGERRHAGRLEHAVGGRPRVPGPTVASEGAHHHVLAHRHAAERLDELEGAAEAEMAAALGREVVTVRSWKRISPASGLMKPLTSEKSVVLPARWADHPHDLPFLDAEADVAHAESRRTAWRRRARRGGAWSRGRRAAAGAARRG